MMAGKGSTEMVGRRSSRLWRAEGMGSLPWREHPCERERDDRRPKH